MGAYWAPRDPSNDADQCSSLAGDHAVWATTRLGDVLGSCVFNLLLIALLDFMYREMPIFSKASQAHILSAGFSTMFIGLVAFSLLSGDPATLRVGHVGVYTPAIIALYIVAVRAVCLHERKSRSTAPETANYIEMTLGQAVVRYAIAGAAVVAGGIAMPFAAVRLAAVMGWGQSFVGTLWASSPACWRGLATAVGALPVLFDRSVSQRSNDVLLGFAAGVRRNPCPTFQMSVRITPLWNDAGYDADQCSS